MDAVEEVKNRLAIEDVIGEYVQLKRAGRNWRGLSPFSAEKTPSFIVSPEKQIWHDFSSGKGGNMFSFVMEMEGLDFRQALELLARKAGVDIEQYRSSSSRSNASQKERLYEALEAAAHFYQVQFSKNKIALEYVFKKRKFNKETALNFRLGYSPTNGSALIDFLKGKGFKETEITGAGLSARAYRGGIQDMFRGRLMIPLQDAQGRVIGFTARLLADDDNAPKYINTPQTILYDKSRHVYGLHLAKESIRKSNYAVLVEGNLDVIASHQAGVNQVVATAGTAMTEQHLKALGRFTRGIRLSFDQDKAGLAATERAIPIAAKTGVNLSIITIPTGKDPDELIRQNPEAWRQVIDQPKYALDWLIEHHQKTVDISSAQGKRQFSDILLPIISGLQDSVEQDHYMLKIAEIMGISREALDEKMSATRESATVRRVKVRKTEAQPIDKKAVDNTKTQDHVLGIVLLHPPIREVAKFLTPEMFGGDSRRELWEFLAKHPEFSGKPEEIKQLAKVQNLADYVKILVLQYEELYQGLELIELRYEVARLQARLVEQFVKTKKQAIIAQLNQANEGDTQTLLEEVRGLDTLLKDVKGGVNGQKES